MTNNTSKLWIRHKRNNFVVQKIQDGKQIQVAKFKTKKLAEDFVDKYKVAAAMEKVVDKEYSFHELFEKFATIKAEGGRNMKTCLTMSGGDRYAAHFRNYIKPNFPDCAVHTIGGKKLQEFIDKLLDKGNKPELYKTAKLVLANMRRFFKWCITEQYHLDFQSALLYRIPSHLEPRDKKLRDKVKATVINPKDAARLLQFVWQRKDEDQKFAYACMIFHILFYFGFRRSEILGLRKTDINLSQSYVDVAGKFDLEHYTYSKETKNAGSKRKVYFNPTGKAGEVLKWIVDKSNELRPDNDYLIPASRGFGPISQFMFRKVLYATYEILGLAKLKWIRRKDGYSFKIVDCPFKDCASKTWRHLKAAQLIKDRATLELSEDYIKRIMGHDLYSTTRDIYGNHDLLEVEEHHKVAARIEQLRNKEVKLLN